MKLKLMVVSAAALSMFVNFEDVSSMAGRFESNYYNANRFFPSLKEVRRLSKQIQKRNTDELNLNARMKRRNSTIGIPNIIRNEIDNENNMQNIFSPLVSYTQPVVQEMYGLSANPRTSMGESSSVSINDLSVLGEYQEKFNQMSGQCIPFDEENQVKKKDPDIIDNTLGNILYGIKLALRTEKEIVDNQKQPTENNDNEDVSIYKDTIKQDMIFSKFYQQQLDKVVNWQQYFCHDLTNVMGLKEEEIRVTALDLKKHLSSVGFEISDVMLGYLLGSKHILYNQHMSIIRRCVMEHIEGVLKLKKNFWEMQNRAGSERKNQINQQIDRNDHNKEKDVFYLLNKINKLEEHIEQQNKRHKEEIKKLEDQLCKEQNLNLNKNIKGAKKSKSKK